MSSVTVFNRFTTLMTESGSGGGSFANLFFLAGGLGMFLYGMTMTSDALKTLAGKTMQRVVALLTSNRFLGLILGALMTVMLNSSSATTVLCVTLASAGLLRLRESGALLLGAGIGTALTVQIMAFNIGDLALTAIFIGAAVRLNSSTGRRKHLAEMLIGIGLIFYGMIVMKAGSAFLRENPSIRQFLGTLDAYPILALLVSVMFTGIIQSSAGTIVIVFELVLSGTLHMESGVAMVLGANIGTAVTGLLSAIGQPRVGKQVALEMMLFRVLGVIVVFPFLKPLVEFSSTTSVWMGASAVSKRAIANSHLIFNLFLATGFLPVLGPITRLLDRLVKRKPTPADRLIMHLTPDARANPDTALSAVQNEGARLVARLSDFIRQMRRTLATGNADRLSPLYAETAILSDYRLKILLFARTTTVQHHMSESPTIRETTGWIEKTGSVLQLITRVILPNAETLFGGQGDVPLESAVDIRRMVDCLVDCLHDNPAQIPSEADLMALRKNILRRQSDRLLRGLEEAVTHEEEFRGLIEGLHAVGPQLLGLRTRMAAQKVDWIGTDDTSGRHDAGTGKKSGAVTASPAIDRSDDRSEHEK